jgi:hypothetical protein
MSRTQTVPLGVLYETDETAWLEAMAELVGQRRFAELDHRHLSEYLADMARRDRREVQSRLVTLLAHLLKWQHQPDHRSPSWRGTILEQRRELRGLLESGTLRNHALAVLAGCYDDARKQAAAETDLPLATFPAGPAPELDALLDDDALL